MPSRSSTTKPRQAKRHNNPRGQGRRQRGETMGIVAHVAALVAQLQAAQVPADSVVGHYFKDNRQLGPKERHWVAEAAYCWLRHRLRIQHLVQSAPGSAAICIARIALVWSKAPHGIWSMGPEAENAWLGRVLSIDAGTLPEEPRYCLPAWLINSVRTQAGESQLEQYALVCLQSAPLDIRINTLKADVETVQATLHQAGVESAPIAGLPNGLRIQGKPALQTLPAFTEGWFEVQDAGSQWLAQLVAPRRGDLIVDFCAGAGGKTLAVAALMRNTGRIVAVDTSTARLLRLKPRAARAGVSSIYTLGIHDETDARLVTYRGKADRVFVDAPCTGLGTLRRNPDLKTRQTPQDLAELQKKQLSILIQAAHLVKPDGRLIYMTCSILQDENEHIVEQFLALHPDFYVRNWTEVLPPPLRPLTTDGFPNPSNPHFRVWPNPGVSDGFFAAVLQKRKTTVAQP